MTTVYPPPHFVATHRIRPRPRPPAPDGWWTRTRALYFSTPWSGALTVLLVIGLAWFGTWFIRWGVVDAVFTTGALGQEACRVDGAGACWAAIGDKFRLILFGVYPYDLQWRPALAVGVLLIMYAVSAWRRCWKLWLAALWVLAVGLYGVLMRGGVLGLSYVPEDQWGGLPVTLILATLSLAAGFPIATLLALLRHSERPSLGKALAVAFIEIARSVPLLAVLFLASVMIPLFLPQDVSLSKLFRVFVAFALFSAAYLAEVIRGGLLTIPRGQYEAAAALGLSKRVTTVKIVLPQAYAAVLPAIVNVFIAFFKATSIVVVVGIFDLMTAAQRAVADPAWQGFGTEVYLFVGAIYFAFCFAMSRYSASIGAGTQMGRQV